MTPTALIEYLHILFAFVFTGAIMAAHWNTLAARRVASWSERAAHFELNRRLSLFFSIPALIGTGVVGQVVAIQRGYSMAGTRLFQIANGMWLVLLIVTLVIEMPAAARLASLARGAAQGAATGEPVGWSGQLGRWRLGNALQLLLFLILLGIMVAPWQG